MVLGGLSLKAKYGLFYIMDNKCKPIKELK